MAEVLTFLADEVGKALALVWGGVGIAVKLNYEVMSGVVSLTARIVHILLLLTQKTSDLFSILANDTMLFVGDIGSGVLAASKTASNFVTGIAGAVRALGAAAVAACCYVWSMVGHAQASLVHAFIWIVNQIGNVLYMAKNGFILFGSSVAFAISFVPNLISLLVTVFVEALVNFWWRSSLFLHNCVFFCKHLIKTSSNSVWEYFSDIPVHAILGVCLGVVIIIGLRYLLQFMINNFILIPDIPFRSLVMNTRRQILGWYVRVWRDANRPLERENTREEEFIDGENADDDEDVLPPPVPPPPEPEASSSAIIREEPMSMVSPRGRRPIRRRKGAFGLGGVVTDEEVLEEVTQGPKSGGNPRGAESLRWVKQLYKELEDEKEGKLCIICQDRPKRVILLPCRHLCLCDACRSAIIIRDNSCPICRKPILDSLRVYL